MPGGSITSARDMLERGANPRYRDAYDRKYKYVADRVGRIMDLGVPSDKSIELMPYMLAQPHIRAWKDGEAIPEAAGASRSFTIVNRPYGLRVPVRESEAKTFDQVNYILQSIAQGGESAAWLPERVLFQIILGTTDSDLLPSIPNAADGGSLYSTTDGGGASRFAVASVGGSGGNIRVGTGVAAVANFIADLNNAIGQAQRWQDGQGQPLWPDDVFEQEMSVLIGAHNRLIAQQAMAQKFVFQTSGGAAAAPTNLILDAANRINYWITQRIPVGTDSWFIFFEGVHKKSLVNTIATPVRYIFKTPENSDWCQEYRSLLMSWDTIQGFGVGEAFATMKVSN
jgi:hypothetical protein